MVGRRRLGAGDHLSGLRTERQGAAALLLLDRPEKRNALSLDLREAIAGELGALAADETVAAAVIAGEGSAFCAGMDVGQFGGDRANRERIVSSSIGLFRALAQFPAPLIAAVHGPALAGGFAMALLCDVRVAGHGAQFGFVEAARGIPASYAAARAVLAPGPARELALAGRVVDAREAQALGLVAEVVEDPRARALELARELAERPRGFARASKRRFLAEQEAALAELFAQEERELRSALLGP